MSDCKNPYARAYRARDSRVFAVPFDEMTLNKRAFSSASHFDLSALPDAFARDNETHNKKLFSRRSLYNIHALPDPFVDNEETQNKRAFSSRSQADLRALPDFVYPAQTPRSSLSNTSLASNYSNYSLQSNDSGYARTFQVLPPLSATVNKNAWTSQSACDIRALPDPFSRAAGGGRRGPVTPSRALSSYGSNLSIASEYQPTALEQFMNAECSIDLDDSTQNKRALTRESVMDVRLLPDQFAIDSAPRPLPPQLMQPQLQQQEMQLHPVTPTKALNKYALSAESQHDLHNLPCPFENVNPYRQVRSLNRRMRDFSRQSMEDLRRCPSIEDVSTARSFTQTQADRFRQGRY
ncbi:hypothetical protein PRIPAC_72981 [Pristionchus pacificus]|uniref:Uncharacterized protein n=1 Tax=Pristionchus pacificus TaxID=54126 RepID=A0A454XXP5_PRIPA|nr:hypothetical protein PRIPAC_72981 [Pristionchus pacificus]|eukprot:PDM73264.1 hypothetical protein PRIPAC_40620 [Pristionchus pacificus]